MVDAAAYIPSSSFYNPRNNPGSLLVTFLSQLSFYGCWVPGAHVSGTAVHSLSGRAHTHPGQAVISKKNLKKCWQLLFQAKLSAELGQLFLVQKPGPCGVAAAVDVPEL